MDTSKLADLVSQRRTIVVDLMDLAEQQLHAISHGHMNELMHVLGQKQRPLSQLGTISASLRQSIGENPDHRHWESDEARAICRQENDECEQLLAELLQLEAQCETALQQSRSSIETQLTQVTGAKQATVGYASNEPVSGAVGSRLDLSSQ